MTDIPREMSATAVDTCVSKLLTEAQSLNLTVVNSNKTEVLVVALANWNIELDRVGIRDFLEAQNLPPIVDNLNDPPINTANDRVKLEYWSQKNEFRVQTKFRSRLNNVIYAAFHKALQGTANSLIIQNGGENCARELWKNLQRFIFQCASDSSNKTELAWRSVSWLTVAEKDLMAVYKEFNDKMQIVNKVRAQVATKTALSEEEKVQQFLEAIKECDLLQHPRSTYVAMSVTAPEYNLAALYEACQKQWQSLSHPSDTGSSIVKIAFAHGSNETEKDSDRTSNQRPKNSNSHYRGKNFDPNFKEKLKNEREKGSYRAGSSKPNFRGRSRSPSPYPSQSSKRGRSVSFEGPGLCFNCGKSGHWAANCRDRPKDNKWDDKEGKSPRRGKIRMVRGRGSNTAQVTSMSMLMEKLVVDDEVGYEVMDKVLA
jgi:hypothetical protein